MSLTYYFEKPGPDYLGKNPQIGDIIRIPTGIGKYAPRESPMAVYYRFAGWGEECHKVEIEDNWSI